MGTSTLTPSARVQSAMNHIKDFSPKEKRDLVMLLVESLDETPSGKRADNKEDNAARSFCGVLKDYGTADEFMSLIRRHRNLGRKPVERHSDGIAI